MDELDIDIKNDLHIFDEDQSLLYFYIDPDDPERSVATAGMFDADQDKCLTLENVKQIRDFCSKVLDSYLVEPE